MELGFEDRVLVSVELLREEVLALRDVECDEVLRFVVAMTPKSTARRLRVALRV